MLGVPTTIIDTETDTTTELPGRIVLEVILAGGPPPGVVASSAELEQLAIEGRKLLPGPNADWIDAPLDVAYGALLVVLQTVGPTRHHYRKHHYGLDWYADELDAQLPPLLLELYRDRELREVDELTERMWDLLQDEYDLSEVPADKLEFHRHSVDVALDRAGDPDGWIRLLHTVVELWGPDAAAAAWAVSAAGDPGIDAMLNTAWRVPRHATGEVLGAVGGHHPDKHIAKAARKALFKYRSAA
jgi:hypothetical protein